MDDNDGVREANELATVQNATEIAMRAMDEGDGFVAEEGDLIGLILDPFHPATQEQPFIIGVSFDALAEECIC